ncbi:MAG TPA: hypothetical protein VFB21_25450 [Chthonomonadaceae bacterium]|nr:hypothetical protein [Chthonomonadaceae bacterium]
MKKNINPAVAVVAVVVLLLVVGFVYYKQTTPPPPMHASPLGLDDLPKGKGKGMMPDVQAAIKQQQQNNQGAPGAGGR